ncbi:21927_t:CDS:2, partial [Gigaspora margarita]
MNMTKNKYYKPTSAEINEIINSTIPENTQKATAKWIKILENWLHDLEREMIEFILGIRQVNTNKEYAPSSLINCIKLLSVYILKHPEGTNVFNISNRKEFPHLWEALNGKMKKLKKEGLVLHHHDHLADTELQTIFQHYTVANHKAYNIESLCGAFEFTSNGGIHFKKYSQKNDQGGVDGNSDALIVPVPLDSK